MIECYWMTGYIFWREQCMQMYIFVILLHKLREKTFLLIFCSWQELARNPKLGSCSPTCILPSGYNTFCRNLQKWNLSCFEYALLVVFLLNCWLWHVRSNYSLNCYKTKKVWNFIYKNFSFIHFCSKNNRKVFKGSLYVDIFISQLWVCFFPEMRCCYLKKTCSLV
jgi:hypothetical protein